MKKIYTIIFLIIISGNISAFFYGLLQNYKTDLFIEKIKIKLLESSALTLAKHTLDDIQFEDTLTQKFIYNGDKIILIIKKIKKDLITVDVNIIKNNKNHFSSFLTKF